METRTTLAFSHILGKCLVCVVLLLSVRLCEFLYEIFMHNSSHLHAAYMYMYVHWRLSINCSLSVYTVLLDPIRAIRYEFINSALDSGLS